MTTKPLREWLRMLIGLGPREVGASIFGKHPAWDDHAELIGAPPEVVRFHVDFYSGALSRAIDRVPQDDSPGYAHDLVWIGHRCTVAARLTRSQDGKGRSLYPLVTCLSVESQPNALWLENTALQECRSLAADIANARTRQEVSELLTRSDVQPPEKHRPAAPELPLELSKPHARDRGNFSEISLETHHSHSIGSIAQSLSGVLPHHARALLSQRDDQPLVRIAFSPIAPEFAQSLLEPGEPGSRG